MNHDETSAFWRDKEELASRLHHTLKPLRSVILMDGVYAGLPTVFGGAPGLSIKSASFQGLSIAVASAGPVGGARGP
jgi:hypothetical protein